MNHRMFSMAILISSLPFLGSPQMASHFNKGDFIAREKNGSTIEMKLSKSGKAKLKKLRSQFPEVS